jgi:hypothetical protein
MTLEIKRSIVTALVITIQHYWKDRRKEPPKGYIKQSLKALRHIYNLK